MATNVPARVDRLFWAWSHRGVLGLVMVWDLAALAVAGHGSAYAAGSAAHR